MKYRLKGLIRETFVDLKNYVVIGDKSPYFSKILPNGATQKAGFASCLISSKKTYLSHLEKLCSTKIGILMGTDCAPLLFFDIHTKNSSESRKE